MATFGNTSVSGAGTASMTAGYFKGSKFTLAEDGTVTKFTAYVAGAGTNNQAVKISCYIDNAGAPGALKGCSNEVTITAAQAAGWQDFTISSFALTAGTYWLGYFAGATEAGANSYRQTTGGVHATCADSYPTPANPAAAPDGTGTRNYCIYATYTPAGRVHRLMMTGAGGG
jgi:hypothetical protein